MTSAPRLIDPAPVRAHIATLTGYGMERGMIAHATAGRVSDETVAAVAEGRWDRVRAGIADAILAVGPQPHPACRTVLAVGAHRRIRALQRRGWNSDRIDELVGFPHGTCSQILNRDVMTYRLWKVLADAYEPLSACPGMGPSAAAAAAGARNHWPAPMDWDMHDIDDPADWPTAAPPAAVDRPGLDAIVADRRRQVAELTGQGVSLSDIARRLDVTSRTVLRYRRDIRAARNHVGAVAS